ncbi:hypothetical protein E3E11_06655 [Oecophyllibacter saccharovorans]|uniref:portal protein n=1 Tax=Oecophyllibacter saccharovorans TaxID=2558360 RepID=UPI0011449B66|nr:portal protein [Oecophyllibacter saccharovorans]QDH15585.1 hypothetical protein E3E11_06655 [Oecophyllibacter saccharovorans]
MRDFRVAPADDPEAVLAEVRERFAASRDFEADWRAQALEDLRFFHGDARNHNQWDAAAYQARSGGLGGSPRPCLTINKTAQHVFQVENDARQAAMSVKVNATGFGASAKAADVLEGIIRHIEYQSNAQQNAYANAIAGQVRVGMGWVHIVTDYLQGQDSFDQDFFIRSVPDPSFVYSDPNTIEPDHSDMRWAMIVEDIPKHVFARLYPDHEEEACVPLMLDPGEETEAQRETVRVMRYYRRSERRDVLWAAPQPDGTVKSLRQSEMTAEQLRALREAGARHRAVTQPHVEFFLIAGSTIVSHGPTVFRHVPLVPFVGIESVIRGRLDRHGLVRPLIDPQRMYNYSASAFVESVALQAKAPWLVDERAVEGWENEWSSANTSNRAYLPYRGIDPDDATPIPAPQRLDPPTGSTGHLQAMQNADLQMQMVTGQYQAEMGAPGNEKSGRAINERQRQSDTANYHYTDNQGMALRLIGKILIEAIPFVYDTRRAVQVMGQDGTLSTALVMPGLDQAAAMVGPDGTPLPAQNPAQAPAPQGSGQPDPGQQNVIEGAMLALNPTIGRYDVEADVGPAFATRRQDAFNAISQILASDPASAPTVLPYLFKASDFPLADEIYEALTAGPSPQLQQAQETIAQLQQELQAAQAHLQLRQADIAWRAQKAQADTQLDAMRLQVEAQARQHRDETDRMAALGSIDPQSLRPVLEELVRQVLAQERGADQPSGPVPEPAPGPAAPLHALPPLPTTNVRGDAVHAPRPVVGAVTPSPPAPGPAPPDAPAPTDTTNTPDTPDPNTPQEDLT